MYHISHIPRTSYKAPTLTFPLPAPGGPGCPGGPAGPWYHQTNTNSNVDKDCQ